MVQELLFGLESLDRPGLVLINASGKSRLKFLQGGLGGLYEHLGTQKDGTDGMTVFPAFSVGDPYGPTNPLSTPLQRTNIKPICSHYPDNDNCCLWGWKWQGNRMTLVCAVGPSITGCCLDN
jgi:hypothetical protein